MWNWDHIIDLIQPNIIHATFKWEHNFVISNIVDGINKGTQMKMKTNRQLANTTLITYRLQSCQQNKILFNWTLFREVPQSSVCLMLRWM
jgi:hypothetical protein